MYTEIHRQIMEVNAKKPIVVILDRQHEGEPIIIGEFSLELGVIEEAMKEPRGGVVDAPGGVIGEGSTGDGPHGANGVLEPRTSLYGPTAIARLVQILCDFV